MKRVGSGGGQRNPAVGSGYPLVRQQPINDKREQQTECDEECEDGNVKPKWLQPSGEPIVNREQRRDERTIRLVAGKRAEGGRVAKKRGMFRSSRMAALLTIVCPSSKWKPL
jgi:hypothetical protein